MYDGHGVNPRLHFPALQPRSIAYPKEDGFLTFWETAWGLLEASKLQASRTSLRAIGYRELDVMLFNIGKKKLRIKEPSAYRVTSRE